MLQLSNSIRAMKWFLAILIVGLAMTGCVKDEDMYNGLNSDIRNIIPEDIMKKFKELGITINGGNNPPNIEGSYLLSPLILVKSNFADAAPGSQFKDYKLTCSEQNNADQTVVCAYASIAAIGSGLGAFITGDGNKFSIFVETNGTLNGQPFKSVDIFSGEITPSGIRNFHWALIQTQEAPGTLRRGQGRLIKDGDGLSERI